VYRANAALGIDFKNNPKVLIVGDSRAANGLNPEHIMSSVNIAQGAEGVEFSYFKIMKAIESNSSIDTVLLAFSYHNLYDNFIEKGIIQRYHLIVNDQYYYDHFGYQSFSLAYVLRYAQDKLYIPVGLSNDIVEYAEIRHLGEELKLPHVGGFNGREGSLQVRKADFLKRFKYLHQKEGQSMTISRMKIEYMLKLRNICAENKVKLYLVNIPTRKDYYALIPKATITSIDSTAYSLTGDYCEYINLSQLNYPDSLYFDCDHLNLSGSMEFSKLVNKVIRETVSQTD
jgi:hypothetical protein